MLGGRPLEGRGVTGAPPGGTKGENVGSPEGRIAERVLEHMGHHRRWHPEAFEAAERSWNRYLAGEEPSGLLCGPAGEAAVKHGGDEWLEMALEKGMLYTVAAAQELGYLLAAHAGWRFSKGVYVYDETVFRALWETPLEGNVPAEALRRLPEHCVYVAVPGWAEKPDLLSGLRGFHAYVEPHARSLVLVPDRDDVESPGSFVAHSYVVPLEAGATIEESLRRMHERLVENARSEENWVVLAVQDYLHHGGYRRGEAREVARLVSVLLYVCSENPEVEGVGRASRPSPPAIRRTKKRGATVLAAQEPTEWRVGWRLGERIRREERSPGSGSVAVGAAPSGARKRAHIRRAHWHSFWRGPRDPSRADERELVVRWIPPLAINARESSEDMPAVVRRVG